MSTTTQDQYDALRLGDTVSVHFGFAPNRAYTGIVRYSNTSGRVIVDCAATRGDALAARMIISRDADTTQVHPEVYAFMDLVPYEEQVEEIPFNDLPYPEQIASLSVGDTVTRVYRHSNGQEVRMPGRAVISRTTGKLAVQGNDGEGTYTLSTDDHGVTLVDHNVPSQQSDDAKENTVSATTEDGLPTTQEGWLAYLDLLNQKLNEKAEERGLCTEFEEAVADIPGITGRVVKKYRRVISVDFVVEADAKMTGDLDYTVYLADLNRVCVDDGHSGTVQDYNVTNYGTWEVQA